MDRECRTNFTRMSYDPIYLILSCLYPNIAYLISVNQFLGLYCRPSNDRLINKGSVLIAMGPEILKNAILISGRF